MTVKVLPDYASISVVVGLCEPWIELWAGDEWGEVMWSLHGACHTDYGFSDEDCALFASKLFENLDSQREWVEREGYQYSFKRPADAPDVQEQCRGIRDYWRNGGNLTGDDASIKAARETLATVPGWVFGE